MKGRAKRIEAGDAPTGDVSSITPNPDDASKGVHVRRRKQSKAQRRAEILAAHARLEKEATEALARFPGDGEIEIKPVGHGIFSVEHREQSAKVDNKNKKHKLSIDILEYPPVAEYDVREYTYESPSSEPADASQHARMDDNHDIDISAELAKARAGLAISRLLTTYETLTRLSDLTNPKLDPGERLRRAENLLKTYERLRKVSPNFTDTGDQIRAAHRIHKAAYRARQNAKNGTPKRPPGRPRTKGLAAKS